MLNRVIMSTSRMLQIKKVIKNPRILMSRILMLPIINKHIGDKTYLKWVYYFRTGKKINIDKPKTFNDKINWLKLHNTSQLYSLCVDKYLVRSLIQEKLGEQYLIPLIGSWRSFDDIDFDQLPNQFVLKCSHDSGSVFVCHDKSRLSLGNLRKKFSKALKKNYFFIGREYPYKNLEPRIICEKLMVDNSNPDLVDYKFFCFNGTPRILFYASERFTSDDGIARFDFYDMQLNHLNIRRPGHKNSKYPLSISIETFNKMKDICSILSAGFPFVRVDLYLINDKIYFGELTFYPGGGFVDFEPNHWNDVFGNWIDLKNC